MMTDDLTCTEQMTEEQEQDAPVPARSAVVAPLHVLPVQVRKVDLADAVVRRVQEEACAHDRRNPHYVEQVQRHGMTIKWRSRMCRWMFATGEAFKLAVDTVGAAVHFMDLYLSLHSVDHVVIQLVAMLSLCVASKMHEHRPISMLEMDLLCEHKFTHKQMIAMEKQLLIDLEWQLNPAVCFTFARDLLHLAGFEQDQHKQEVVETQVMDLLQSASITYDSLGFKDSVLGCAALYAVVENLVPQGTSKVCDVLQLLECDDEEFDACIEFVEGVFDAQRAEARQLASPTSVENTSVIEVVVKDTVKPKSTTEAKTLVKAEGKSRKRARDEEESKPKRRRLAMD